MAPSMPPPETAYISYSPERPTTPPTRPWTPSVVGSEYARPRPLSRQYEERDVDGSPRPGRPSSQYGGSSRRLLPPVPLFSRNSTFGDDETVSIPLGPVEDVFGGGDEGHKQRQSYASQSQATLLSESDGGHDDDDGDHDGDHDGDDQQKTWGPVPEAGKQKRRGVRATQFTRKEVQLINGELVLECKIPSILYSFLPRRDEAEFTHMRYTAVTCDPDDFVSCGYKLRQNMGRTARETELFICVTMYNEDEFGFTRTMHAIMKNISHFCSRSRSRIWGEQGWQKIVICVVSDGRDKVHPRTLDALAAMGLYQHGIAKNFVNQKAVQAHVYELTTQVSLDQNLRFRGAEKGIVPCQMIFCLKEKNQKKLNSHRWFFNAFGRALQPNVCILLDVGTRPGPKSLYHLWKTFDTDSNVAGACGEIKAMLGSSRTCLSPDTMVRTTKGDKAVGDVAVGDQLMDHQDRPVQCLAAEPIQTSPAMKRVIYQEWNSIKKMSFVCTPNHLLTLVASRVKPYIHEDGKRVSWWTRCVRTEPAGEEAPLKLDTVMHDLYAEVQQRMGRRPTDDEFELYLRDITGMEEMSDSDKAVPASPALVKLLADLKAKDVDLVGPDLSAVHLLLREHMDEPVVLPYSTTLTSERAEHLFDKFAYVREKMAHPNNNNNNKIYPCRNATCKALRRVTWTLQSKVQAKVVHRLLLSDHYRMVDACAVKNEDLFTMTVDEYLASCTASRHKLKLYRARLAFMPYQGPVSPVPLDPYFLGFWLGNRNKADGGITSSDMEIKVFLQAYADRLNMDRPAGVPPLKMHESSASKTCWHWQITGGDGLQTDPITTALTDLHLLGDKSAGIPDCYMQADRDTRLRVLAGLIDSDGWLIKRANVYGFAQHTLEHKKMVFDAHKLAVSCGIGCTKVVDFSKGWQFHMTGTENMQHHLLMPRNRLSETVARQNQDMAAFKVEEAGEGEYRLIEVSGQLFQLADGTVVHNCSALGSLLNPIVASQNFEYKMSNILDKPLESVFGYITVLPGALSAYRYHALQNDENGHGPLSQYFKGETLHGQHADVFTANMYLAEDRILCWELVAKRGERWVLKYVKKCTGETDVPDTVPEFISQRRRWLNGAFFAAVYSLVHFRQIWQTDHSFGRKVLLHVEFVYQAVQLLFTFFSMANFYLTFYFVAGGLADPHVDPFGGGAGAYIFTGLRYVFVLLTAAQFIISLGNRPQGASRLYLASMVTYGVIMAYNTFAVVFIMVREVREDALQLGNNAFTNLVVSVASTVGLYFFTSFMYMDFAHMFTSSAQYFVLLPSYICTLQVYAFCNTHDVTWGTKGDNVMRTDLGRAVGKGSTVELEMPSEQLDIDSGYDEALRNLRDRVEVPPQPVSEDQMQQDYYKSVRTYMVVLWMVANVVLAMAVSELFGSHDAGNNAYLRFILWAVAALALFRAIGSTTFAIINLIETLVEGRVRMSLKVPQWMGGVASRLSDTMSGIGSSLGSRK